MPFKSEAQRRFMHAQHPGIAERWEKEYGKVPTAKASAMNNTAFKKAVQRRLASRSKGVRPFPSPKAKRGRSPLPTKMAPSGRLVTAPGKPGAPTRSTSPISQLDGVKGTPMQMAAARRLKGRVAARPMPVAARKSK